MIRAVRPRLEDIEQNIQLALAFIEKRTLKHVTHDYALRYGLQYAILIIAEAVNHLPADIKAKEPTVPWRNIVAIGNLLRHEYHRVDPDVIWNVATVHLKPLHVAVKKLLADLDQPALPL